MRTLPTLAAAILAVALAAVSAASAAPYAPMTVKADRTPLSCDGKPADFHADRAKEVVRKAFAGDRILDPTPAKQREKTAWRSHKLCLRDRDRRQKIGRFVERREDAFAAFFVELITPPGMAVLNARGACEADSSGGYAADTGNGYQGRYQFDQSSWNLTAGTFTARTGIAANPSRLALPREQDIRAAIWDQMSSGDPWPNCP